MAINFTRGIKQSVLNSTPLRGSEETEKKGRLRNTDDYDLINSKLGPLVAHLTGQGSTPSFSQNRFSLGLTPLAQNRINSFLQALQDPSNYEPMSSDFPEVVELAKMARDYKLIRIAQETSREYEKYVRDRSNLEDFKKSSLNCYQYAAHHYPNALATLRQYYADVTQDKDDKKDVKVDVVVAVEAVTSVTVWANVAAVTNVAVTAVAVAVVAVVAS